MRLHNLLFFILMLITLKANSQWVQKEFLVGTFIDPSPDSIHFANDTNYLKKVSLAKSAYFNFFTGLGSRKDHYYKPYLNYKFSVLKKSNIKSLYAGGEFLNLNTYNSKEKDLFNYTGFLDSSLKSTLNGYFVIDEPGLDGVNIVRNVVSSIKKNDTSRLAYVNLLPIYALKSKEEYDQYLNAYLNLNADNSRNLDVVSYDFYPFLANGGFQANYFYNLNEIRRKAGDRPLWFYVNTTAHGEYPNPNEYQLYFTAFMPLAYGAKGLLYFTYETIQNSSTGFEFGEAIIDKKQQPSSKFLTIKNINRFISQIAGPIIMKSELLGTFHVSDIANNEMISQEQLVSSNMPILSKISSNEIVCGIFKNIEIKGDYNILFVNKSSSKQYAVFISLRGDKRGKVNISRPVAAFNESLSSYLPIKTEYDPETNESRIFVDFDPGEIRIIKVKDVLNSFEPIIIPTVSEMNIYPNPSSINVNVSFNILKGGFTDLKLTSTDGKIKKEILKRSFLTPGKYYITYNSSDLPAGFYIAYLTNGKFRLSQKIIRKDE